MVFDVSALESPFLPISHQTVDAGSVKSDVSPTRARKAVLVAGAGTGAMVPLDPSAESSISLPGLRRSLIPKWSNGWAWEGAPYKAKIFLNVSSSLCLLITVQIEERL